MFMYPRELTEIKHIITLCKPHFTKTYNYNILLECVIKDINETYKKENIYKLFYKHEKLLLLILSILQENTKNTKNTKNTNNVF